MANEAFTQLPSVTSSQLTDIIAAVQGGATTQQTLQQVFTLMLANVVLHNAGDPNGSVAGVVYQLCWDTANSDLYVCTVSGNSSTAVWTIATSSTSLPLPLSEGGTGASLTASNGGIFYSTATTGAILAGTATAGQMLQSGSSSAPSWSTATYPSTTTANRLIYSTSNNVIGELTSANSAILGSSSAGVPTWLGPMTNGQLIIGSTGATPVVASLTAGMGVTIVPGAGTITISASGGGLSWSEITSATQAISVSSGYIVNRGGGVTFSLPATSAVGDTFSIVGKSGIWSITQAAGQQINVGSTSSTLGATGTCTAAAGTDSVNFVCITANTIWQVQGAPQSAGLILA